MKETRLVPYVEIITPKRRRRSEALSSDSSPETEVASSNLSPSKKPRLENDTILDGLTTLTLAHQRLALCESPTVSEFEIPISEGLRLSPTVLDLGAFNARQVSPTISDYENGNVEAALASPDLSYFELPLDEIFFYEEDNVLEEDENLEVEGETPVDENDSDYDPEEVPVRTFDDFSIFDVFNHKLVPLGQLTEIDHQKENYVAVGRVRSYSELNDGDRPDIDSEDTLDAGERVKLSQILELNTHYYSDSHESFDRKIYIRTKFSWYILVSPSTTYTPFFLPFFIPHQICHMYLSGSLAHPDLTHDDFLHALPDFQDDMAGDGFLMVDDVLERPLAAEDVKCDETTAYLWATLPTILSEFGLSRLKRVPLIANVLGADIDEEDSPYVSDGTGSRTLTDFESDISSTRRPTKRKGPKVPGKQLQFTPVVTPTVKDIAENLFTRPLKLAGDSLAQFKLADLKVVQRLKTVQAHHEEDPKSVVWGSKPEGVQESIYDYVKLDGVPYYAEDTVMVHYDEDSYKDYSRASNYVSAAAHSVNSYANRVWFCRIWYFFESKDGDKMFHAQWFHHGSKTILQETAHSKCLFLGETCNDIPVASIVRKCTVQMLDPGQNEMPDDKTPDGDEFFCSLLYDEDNFSFLDLPRQSEVQELLKLLPSHRPCHACALERARDNARIPYHIENSVVHFGVAYHLHDFVYVKPAKGSSRNDLVLRIAQIVDLLPNGQNPTGKQQLEVCFLQRYDDLVKEDVSQERRLVITDDVETISFEEVDGKCFVKYFEKNDKWSNWIENNDSFWLNQERKNDEITHLKRSSFQKCNSCLSEYERSIYQRQEALAKHGPLRGLELFSGAGGLGTGFDMSQYVETKWAVELDGAAAKSYQKNHPNTTVYCQDSNALLQHAILTSEEKKPAPLLSNYKDPKAPKCDSMPRRDEVDIIYGGPPCQAFSGFNHTMPVNDLRSTLPTNMLSYLEFYAPDYFLLENVIGLFQYSCKATQSGRRMLGGIKMGMVKLIVRALIALGYQARFKILQAGQYGCPQHRQRIIFWGAKRGLKLPNFPIPTHAFGKAQFWKLPIDRTGKQVLQPASRCPDPDPEKCHAFAPLKPVSVNDATSDLPPFDWVNPHRIIPTRQNKSKRSVEGILQFDAVLEDHKQDMPGYPQATSYFQEPRNAYQRWSRRNFTTSQMTTEVTGQVTPRFKSRIVEATTTLPLKPLANHKDLPKALWPDCASKKQKDKIFYGRLDGESYFRTALTIISPAFKMCYLIHPSQRRVVTYREVARAQGFPDHYEFLSENDQRPNVAIKQIYKQIGNAVPVPMALALGLALGDALAEDWKKKEREGSPVI